MPQTPAACVGCGTLVESMGLAHLNPFGAVRLTPDRRVPAGHLIVAPPMCWECRGAVIGNGPWQNEA